MEGCAFLLIYLFVGAAAGVVNGLFGAGGGLLLVPLMIRFCKFEQKQAFATALMVMTVLSAVSLTVYAVRGHVDVSQALPYLIGGIVGGILGGLFMKRVRIRFLRLALAAFMLYGGIKAVMLW